MNRKKVKRLSVFLILALIISLVPSVSVMVAKKKKEAKKFAFTVEYSDYGNKL